MNVSAALDWLFSTQFFGIKLGLDNTEKLLAAAGADRINATVVHVAGTNGKGSTCAMIEALARAQGYVTGLFTSPHLVDFSERIRVNGNMITPDALAEPVEGGQIFQNARRRYRHGKNCKGSTDGGQSFSSRFHRKTSEKMYFLFKGFQKLRQIRKDKLLNHQPFFLHERDIFYRNLTGAKQE